MTRRYWPGASNGSALCFVCTGELDERGGKLLVAGTAPPAEALPFKLRDLGSRLNDGLVLTLQRLDESEQIAALRLRAQLRGLELPDETAQFMLRTVASRHYSYLLCRAR